VSWGHLERVEPSDMDPVKRDPEDCGAKGRGLDQGISSLMKPEPPRGCNIQNGFGGIWL